MPPPRPIWSAVSAFVASSVDRPSATPAPTSAAVRSDARPIAQSHPKKSLPHWMPPKRSRWRARIVARAAGARTGAWRSMRSSTPSRSSVVLAGVTASVASRRSRSGRSCRVCGRKVVDERARCQASSRAASSRSLLVVVVRRRGTGRGPRAADGDRAAAAAASSWSSARSARSATVVSSVRSVMAPVVSAGSRARSSRAASRRRAAWRPAGHAVVLEERSAARRRRRRRSITSRSRSPGDWRSNRAVSTRSFDSSSSRSATVVSRSRVATEARFRVRPARSAESLEHLPSPSSVR